MPQLSTRLSYTLEIQETGPCSPIGHSPESEQQVAKNLSLYQLSRHRSVHLTTIAMQSWKNIWISHQGWQKWSMKYMMRTSTRKNWWSSEIARPNSVKMTTASYRKESKAQSSKLTNYLRKRLRRCGRQMPHRKLYAPKVCSISFCRGNRVWSRQNLPITMTWILLDQALITQDQT